MWIRTYIIIGILGLWPGSLGSVHGGEGNNPTISWWKENLVPIGGFKPYPTIVERDAWATVDSRVYEQLDSFAREKTAMPWPSFPAAQFLEYSRSGERSSFQALYFDRRQRTRVFAAVECVENKGRFRDQIVNGLWLICEESSWALPAHLPHQGAGATLPDVRDPVLDLFAAETGAQMAWISYLMRPVLDGVSPQVVPRIVLEVEKRVLSPFLSRTDYPWMGSNGERKLNNWSPWIVSNVLACALLLENDASRRVDIVRKCVSILNRYMTSQSDDGYCEEGPSYWNNSAGSAFDALELLDMATNGKFGGYGKKLSSMAKYIYEANVSDGWFANFGDASARAEIDGPMCFRFGETIGDPKLKQFGAWFAQRAGRIGLGRMDSMGRVIPALLRSHEILEAPASLPLEECIWWPDMEVLAIRSTAGSDMGLFLAAKGGSNTGSHGHNDVGSCIVFADGRPVLIDSGPGSYTRETFGSGRYNLWTMQSAFHNVPTINGNMQSAGSDFKARSVRFWKSDIASMLEMDIAGAYPASSGIGSWVRQYTFRADGKFLMLKDDYSLKKWDRATQWHFLVPNQPEVVAPGRIVLYNGSKRPVVMEFEPSMAVDIREVDTQDPPLRRSWGNRIYRITLTQAAESERGEFLLKIQLGDD